MGWAGRNGSSRARYPFMVTADEPFSRRLPSPCRIVVLISGGGTNLQALLDACADPAYGAQIVAVGADRPDPAGFARAEKLGIPTFHERVQDHPSREHWDVALAAQVAQHEPDLVVLAGFMKLTGPTFLELFEGVTINTHPALSPSFPGVSGPQDALDYGVKVTGATLFVVDSGVDAGVVLAQRAVDVLPEDTAETLHERIKVQEREMLVNTVFSMVHKGWTVTGRKVTMP